MSRPSSWLGIGAAAVVGFVVVAYVVLEAAPDLFAETDGLDPKGRSDERQGVRTASLALLAGAIGVVGAVYSARTFALNRAGQLTDRFTKATEQLGSKELDVRLGGIYALERIARDSPEDHPQVMEVLTAYVREHAPRPERPDESERKDAAAEPKDAVTEPDVGRRVRVRPLPRVPTDVQAVIRILGRRKAYDVSRLDLSRTELRRMDLRGGQFAEADLSQSILARANLTDADLSNAMLMRADFSGARLTRAILVESKMSGAILKRAQLDGADLRGANLSGAVLSAVLEDARYDADTKWPVGIDPEAAGAKRIRRPPTPR
jgi:Pentapeptide repeats (8 copies)